MLIHSPDFPLERRAAQVERQIETDGRVFNQPDDEIDETIIVDSLQRPIGIVSLQVLDERVPILADQDGGDTLGTGGDQNSAERRRASTPRLYCQIEKTPAPVESVGEEKS